MSGFHVDPGDERDNWDCEYLDRLHHDDPYVPPEPMRETGRPVRAAGNTPWYDWTEGE